MYTRILFVYNPQIVIKKAAGGSAGKGIMKVDHHEMLADLVDMLDIGKPLIFQVCEPSACSFSALVAAYAPV
jgi:hypothetical protein